MGKNAGRLSFLHRDIVGDAPTVEEVNAWVKPKPGVAEIAGANLAAFGGGRITTCKIPRYRKFVGDFSMTITGKVRKIERRKLSLRLLGLDDAAKIQAAEENVRSFCLRKDMYCNAWPASLSRKTEGGRKTMKKLYLSDADRKIGGVCGGLGEYFERDPTIIRILFVLLILFSFGFGLLAYLALWLIIPKKPSVDIL